MVAELGFPIRWQKFHEVSEVHAPLLFKPTFYCLTTLSLQTTTPLIQSTLDVWQPFAVTVSASHRNAVVKPAVASQIRSREVEIPMDDGLAYTSKWFRSDKTSETRLADKAMWRICGGMQDF